MGLGGSLDGVSGALLISVPWIVLALAAWRTGRGPVSQPGTVEPLAVMMQPQSPHQDLSADADGGCEEAVFVLAEEVPVLSPREQEEGLVLALEAARVARDDALLSSHSVQLARLLLVRSERPKAAQLLQTAALVARRAKLPVVHAEARMELAELALLDGDLTSACEHWQMAKLMFHELGRRVDQDRVAEMMRKQRCPTDWVLTNF
jgi:hypothetical protein